MTDEVKAAAKRGEQDAKDCIEIVHRLRCRNPLLFQEVQRQEMSLEDLAYIIVLHWKAFNRVGATTPAQVLLTKEQEQLWAIILTIEREPVLGQFIANTHKPIRVTSNDVRRAHQALETQRGKVVIGTKAMLLAHAFDLCEEDFQDEPTP